MSRGRGRGKGKGRGGKANPMPIIAQLNCELNWRVNIFISLHSTVNIIPQSAGEVVK